MGRKIGRRYSLSMSRSSTSLLRIQTYDSKNTYKKLKLCNSSKFLNNQITDLNKVFPENFKYRILSDRFQGVEVFMDQNYVSGIG